MAAPDRAQAKWFPEEDRQRVSVDGKNGKKITFERFEPMKRDKMKKPISLSFTGCRIARSCVRTRVSIACPPPAP